MSTDNEKTILEIIRKLSMEEKIKLLSVEDKLYLAGFIDHALQSSQKQRNNQEGKP